MHYYDAHEARRSRAVVVRGVLDRDLGRDAVVLALGAAVKYRIEAVAERTGATEAWAIIEEGFNTEAAANAIVDRWRAIASTRKYRVTPYEEGTDGNK